ncbi:hypothetical protein FPRO06_11803 [Fusarium proliferatum]|nr:hypothetical protein FPRO06_11803 [Fusarium proliferatum]
MPSNRCYVLNNKPTAYQKQKFKYATLADGASLEYDCFMPTGETYEFLPCAPWPSGQVLGYERFRGTHRIMEMEGPPAQGQDAFMPYKLLLYKGRDNADPAYDDRHRFVYLAENKPGEPAVGDCFIRLEEIHKRMKGTATDYTADCARYNMREAVIHDLTWGDQKKAKESRRKLQRDGKWILRFRCWTVYGNECDESENRLRNRLFKTVYRANDYWDHFDVFRVWAELLRKSQGDKLAAKDFFGRYWDAVIPNDWSHWFQDGFRIVVGENWFQGNQLNYKNDAHRKAVRTKVFEAIQRAVDAPRLKFKPPLTINNVFFEDQLNHNGNDHAPGWFEDGWRYLEGHPGELYQIVVNLQVRQFLCLDTHKRPFWQEGYGYPEEPDARRLNFEHLDKCRSHQTKATKTLINTKLLSGLVKKRHPTQDRCVAENGYSANVAMSDAFPNFYPEPAHAKRLRVAERLATFSNNGEHAAIVETKIDYSALEQAGRWMGDDDHQYTWLAANLKYHYYSIIDENLTKGHVNVTRNLFPFNRESCLLFQSILDKSLENLRWGWNCWDANRVVVDALLESTVIDGNKEELDKDEVKEKLKQATDEDQEGSLDPQDLELVVQLNLAS